MLDSAIRTKLYYATLWKAADMKVFQNPKSLELNLVCIPQSHGSFPELMLLISPSALYWKGQKVQILDQIIDQKHLELYQFNKLYQFIWLENIELGKV